MTYRSFGDINLENIPTKGSIVIRDSAVNPDRLIGLLPGADNTLLVPNATAPNGLEYIPYKVNLTYYVDAVNGNNTTAQPNIPYRSYATIDAALTAATGPAIIYVQPGTYTPGVLTLKNNVHFFFSEGVIINSPNSIFTDAGSPVTSVIISFGQIISTNTIITTTATSNISMLSFFCQTTGTDPMFDFTSPTSIMLTVNRCSNTSTGNIVNLSGATSRLTYNGQLIICAAQIFNISSTTTGSVSGLVNRVTAGSATSTAIEVNSNNLELNFEIQNAIFNSSAGQAIRIIDNSANPSSNLHANIKIGDVTCTGGLLYTEGIAGLANALDQPRVSLYIQSISATSSVNIFNLHHCLNSIIYNQFGFFMNNNSTYCITLQDDTVTQISGQRTFDTNNSSGLFLQAVAGVNNQTQVQYRADITFVTNTIINCGAGCSVSFNVDNLINGLATTNSSIIVNGQVTLNGSFMAIFGAPAVGVTNIFDLQAGEMIFTYNVFNYQLDNSICFNTVASTNLSIQSFGISTGSADTTVIYSNGGVIQVNNITGGGANTTLLNIENSVNVNINSLNAGAANCTAIILGTNAGLDGIINQINISQGPLITSTTNGNVKLDITEWQSASSPAKTTNAINWGGNGSLWLNGNVININNCNFGLNLTATSTIHIDVDSIYGNDNNKFLNSTANCSCQFDFLEMNFGNISTVTFDFVDGSMAGSLGNVSINGGPFLSHASGARVDFRFGNMNVGGNTTYVMQFIGTGDSIITGGELNINVATDAIVVGAALVGDNPLVKMDLKRIGCQSADRLIRQNTTGGGAFYFNCQEFTANVLNQVAIDIVTGAFYSEMQTISVSNQKLYNNTSDQDAYLNWDLINADSPSATYTLEFAGANITYLNSQSINFQTCQTCFGVTNANASLYIDSDRISTGSIDFLLQSTTGQIVDIDCPVVNISNHINYALRSTIGLLNLRGQYWSFSSGSVPIPAGIRIEGGACFVKELNFNFEGQALSVFGTNVTNVYYGPAYTKCNDGGLPAINIDANNGEVTICGYISTPNATNIYFDNTNGGYPATSRVLNATLVSAAAGTSIDAVAASNTVIIQPSLARNAVGANITTVPAGSTTLFVDAAVA